MLLLAPLLIVAGALQPDPVLPGPGPGPQARVATPAHAAPVSAPTPAPPTEVAVAFGVVSQRIAAPEPRRVPPRAARDRVAGTLHPTRLTPEQRGRAALDSLRYDWRALGYRVVFRPYAGGSLGTANRRARLITVYVKRAQSEQSLRVTIAHELAHALDFEHGTTVRRDSYRRLRGLSGTGSWFPCSGCNDLASPAGDFAEVFALWLAGPGDFRSQLKPAPDARQLADLVPLFQLPRATPSPSPSPAQRQEAADEQEDDEWTPVVVPPPPPRAA